MAKQSGLILITGTIDDLTFYKMYGTYYVRMKSSLSREKVLKSPRFERTRVHANQLAEASRIASQLYKAIPKEKRNRALFRSIVGQAKVLLAEGKDKEQVMELLLSELNPPVKTTVPKQNSETKPKEKIYVNKAGKLVCGNTKCKLENVKGVVEPLRPNLYIHNT